MHETIDLPNNIIESSQFESSSIARALAIQHFTAAIAITIEHASIIIEHVVIYAILYVITGPTWGINANVQINC